ncbi:unnamed protein product [Cuscuta epithymum]|uniref:Reverse transcriptase zinc-binding domain-containing protein n=1 Tax=Cuscuta epithymum TaxID=186058 RepID=A0AAV0C709_9ASTE|nr:unnamed protein product [Cuscuta epithymum]
MWNKHLKLSIKIFQWKVLHRFIPITDNLPRFQRVIQPSICPMCRNHNDSMNHAFYQCCKVFDIWKYFMDILEIPIISNSCTIRNVFLNWWFQAGSKSLSDVFRHNLLGIICWHIWKSYENMVWGTSSHFPGVDFPNKNLHSSMDLEYP